MYTGRSAHRCSRRLGRRLVASMLLAASPILSGATGLSTNFEGRVLAAQNRERAALGVEPLRWDPELAASARSWAVRLAATDAFEHAPEDPRKPQGENLWAGSRGYFAPEAMVDAWVREKRFFKRGRFPDNSVTGKVEDVGHYTQLVWRDTRRVGCAHATGARDEVLVCRYSSAGNYRGEIPF